MRILAQLLGGIVLLSLFAFGCVQLMRLFINHLETKNGDDQNVGHAEKVGTGSEPDPSKLH